MDPYLEPHWGDVHQSLVLYTRDVLQPFLPGDLCARVEERLVVESGELPYRRISPDVHITETKSWGSAGDADGGVAVAEPLVIELTDLEVTEGYIEIRDQHGRGKLITAIEFLSPTNKLRGDGETKYLQKQREVIEAHANLVEIDLIRAGRYVLAAPEEKVPAAMRADYLACITMSYSTNRRHELYPLSLRRPLPALRIPLRRDEARIVLELQPLLDRAYEAGRYGRSLDYSAPLALPLAADAAAWAEPLLREAR